MWVFCCGMKRSGSTVQFQLTAAVVERAGLGARVEWAPPEAFPQVQGLQPDDGQIRVFKAHRLTGEIEAEFRRGTAAGVYVFRDIRDVVVSTMRKAGLSLTRLMDDGFVEACLEDHRRWTALPRVLVSRYETMTRDLAAEALRIARHLDIPLTQVAAEEIAADHSPQRQRERIEGFRRSRSADDYNADDAARALPRFDPVSLLHENHIQSGRSGDWREALTPAQVREVEKRCGEWLDANGYHCMAQASRRGKHRLKAGATVFPRPL